MKFFFSGEIDSLVGDHWRRVARPMEQRLNEVLGSRNYGPALQEIALIPMIIRPAWQAGHKERRLLKHKERVADYRTWIDFRKFRNGDDLERERLVIKNLIEAIADISRKARSSLNGEALIEDVLQTLGHTRSEVIGSDETG